jgi:putative RecB family exonuclease
LREFLQSARSHPSPEVLHTEEWFDVQMEGTKVAGRIDRMDRAADGAVTIVDYKTGKARPQEDADDSLQLSIYAIAAREKWGYRVGDVLFHNLEGNVQVVSKRTDFQLEQARERVHSVAEHVAAGNFAPKLGFHCTFCGFRGLCPAREKQLPRLTREAATTEPALD